MTPDQTALLKDKVDAWRKYPGVADFHDYTNRCAEALEAALNELAEAQKSVAEWRERARALEYDQYEHPWTINEAAQLRTKLAEARAVIAQCAEGGFSGSKGISIYAAAANELARRAALCAAFLSTDGEGSE